MGRSGGSSESPPAYVVETDAIAIPVDSESGAPTSPPFNPNYHEGSPTPAAQGQLMLSGQLPRHPALLSECPHCHVQNSTTRTRTAPGLITWLVCAGLLVLFWPLCWLPLVMDSMKRTEHYCQNCQMMVAEIPPMQDCCVTHRS